MDISAKVLMEDFYTIANRLDQLKHKQIPFGGAASVNTASLRLIEIIAENEELNATELAERLGVTKGAVSQMAASLCRKGVVEKRQMEGNAKEIYLSLTDLGEKIFQEHQSVLLHLYEKFDGYMAGLSSEEIGKIHGFLQEMGNDLEKYADQLTTG